ncbi:MAG: hypothetical protein P8J89_09220 [Phycisphaerales bacterium]|nr:hypothetical protein [Phycisphaerales bacterium]
MNEHEEVMIRLEFLSIHHSSPVGCMEISITWRAGERLVVLSVPFIAIDVARIGRKAI